MNPVVPRLLGAAVGVCAVLVSAGCSDSVTPGQPSAVTSTGILSTSTSASTVAGPRNAADISPCADLTPADVAAIGLDPSSRQNTDLRGLGASERGCGWTGTDVLVDVLATDVGVEKYKARTDLVGVRTLTIGGQSSLTAQIPKDPLGCRAVSDIPGGSIVIQLAVRSEHEAAVGTDSCTAAIRVMEQVAPILTKQK